MGRDVAVFAGSLSIDPARLRASQAGTAPLPPALLPVLARVRDAPLETLVAELNATPRPAAELQALVESDSAIPGSEHRNAVLTLAPLLTEI